MVPDVAGHVLDNDWLIQSVPHGLSENASDRLIAPPPPWGTIIVIGRVGCLRPCDALSVCCCDSSWRLPRHVPSKQS